MAGRLEGKRAIITGASRGIGLAVARAMAGEGAEVILCSRRLDGVEAAAAEVNAVHPGRAFARACHVGQGEACEALVDWAFEERGPVDVLVNNAGTNPFFGPILALTEAAFDKTFEVNLKGAWRLSVAVARRLVADGRGGAIINMASILGMRAAPLQGVYGMTKAALISMTQTLAQELGPAGIRVNAIAPGLIDTKLAAVFARDAALARRVTDRTALGRVGQPAEVAGIAVFLASDEASFLTGQAIAVDGGFTIN